MCAEHGLSQQAGSQTSEMMRHELDDDTVKLLQPVNAGQVEIDEDFEKEFAALVPGAAPSARASAALVRLVIIFCDINRHVWVGA